MRLSRLILAGCALALLAACSPKYNWRETHGEKVQFSVLLPAKPASFSRAIDLDGIPVTMTMTAAEIDGVTFAVGVAELADSALSAKALAAMRTALIKNIDGTVRPTAIPGASAQAGPTIDVSATGVARGQPLLLMARLLAKEKRVYQVLIIGPEKSIGTENAETFFSSFKPA